MKRWWGELKTTDFGDARLREAIAILPVAAIEQHGPHLPLMTDLAIAEGMIATVLRLAPDDLPILVLPVQPVGKSNEHIHAAGTLTLAPETLITAWTALGEGVARAGLRKLVIVNSHGGNEEVIGIVARELRVRAGLLVAKTHWRRFGLPPGLYSDAEAAHGIHAGDIETSLMLHFRPDLVDLAEARSFRSIAQDMENGGMLLRPIGAHAFAWIASDLNPHGAVGDASKASAEKGRLTAEHQARGFLDLVAEIRDIDLARFGAFGPDEGEG
jgi:creatinine amidohydrolase